MKGLGFGADRAKNAAFWAAEKLGRLKLNGQLTGSSPLSRLIEIEGLLAGINGKLSLWCALLEIARGRAPPRRRPAQRIAGARAGAAGHGRGASRPRRARRTKCVRAQTAAFAASSDAIAHLPESGTLRTPIAVIIADRVTEEQEAARTPRRLERSSRQAAVLASGLRSHPPGGSSLGSARQVRDDPLAAERGRGAGSAHHGTPPRGAGARPGKRVRTTTFCGGSIA